MGKGRVLLLAWTIGSLSSIIASALVLVWFRGTHVVDARLDDVVINLRSVTTCSRSGACITLGFTGLYATAAQAAFWANVVLAALITWQVGTRVLGGTTSRSVVKLAGVIGLLCLADAVVIGFVLAPEAKWLADPLKVQRTWAPIAMLAGDIAGVIALYFARPVRAIAIAHPGIAPAPTARVRPLAAPVARDSASVLPPVTLPRPELMLLDTPPPFDVISPPAALAARAMTAPFALRGRLNYATTSVELSHTGIDGRREDGQARLVAWREVVGVVARRLPQATPFEGVTFVDVVSSAGSTLRILPWTRVTGEPIAHDGDERARTLVQLIASRCPDAQIDQATRRFLGSHGAAAQLPDEATLAAHDQRLA